MELNKNSRKWILILVAISLGMVWLMQRLSLLPQFFGKAVSFFSPLLIGIMIAFIVNLPMRWLERRIFSKIIKGKSRRGRNASRFVSMFFAFLLVAGVIAAIIFMLVPDLVRTMVTFARQLQPAFRKFQLWLDEIGSDSSESAVSIFLANSNLSVNELIMRISNWINNTVTEILSSAFGWITGLLNGFVNFFLGLVFAIYFLSQKEKLGRQIKKLSYAALPERFVDRVLQLGKLINTVFSRFLGGQGLEALILGTLVFTGMQIFRFPYPLTISVLVAIGALIPVFGATIAGILGSLLIVVDSPIQALWFFIMLVSIQQVEGNFIYPRVVGKSVGLPSVWVLFAVTFGSKLFGFFGLLLGVPMFSVLYILMRSWSGRKVREKNIAPEKLAFKTEASASESKMADSSETDETQAAGSRRRRREGQDGTLIDQVSADWHASGRDKTEKEPPGKRTEERPPEQTAPSASGERDKTKAAAAHKVRRVKPLFDLDAFEAELEKETEEARRIRKEAGRKRQKTEE